MKKDPRITLVKAVCMIMVVADHSGCPPALFKVDLSMLMPIFFIASGYFFKERWFDNPKEYARRKFKNLYVPFVKWSIIFLLLHNLFYSIGILNPLYGNDEGVCGRFYPLSEMAYHAMHIILRMAHYDGFLLGTYWFMRVLFVSLLVLCFGGALLNRWLRSPAKSIAVMLMMGLATGGVIAATAHPIPLYPDGGYREAMALFFLGVGYFLHRYERLWQRTWVALVALTLLLAGSYIQPTGMLPAATAAQWAMVTLTGTSGFIFVHRLCCWINDYAAPLLHRTLLYIGENTFYIFTFQFLLMKPASLLKAWYYHLDWHVVGCHPYVFVVQDNWFWLIYIATAVPLCLLLGHWVDKVKWLRIQS